VIPHQSLERVLVARLWSVAGDNDSAHVRHGSLPSSLESADATTCGRAAPACAAGRRRRTRCPARRRPRPRRRRDRADVDSWSSMKAVTRPSRAPPTRIPFLMPGSSCAPVSVPQNSESATYIASSFVIAMPVTRGPVRLRQIVRWRCAWLGVGAGQAGGRHREREQEHRAHVCSLQRRYREATG
jgi:hypothetical protein